MGVERNFSGKRGGEGKGGGSPCYPHNLPKTNKVSCKSLMWGRNCSTPQMQTISARKKKKKEFFFPFCFPTDGFSGERKAVIEKLRETLPRKCLFGFLRFPIFLARGGGGGGAGGRGGLKRNLVA